MKKIILILVVLILIMLGLSWFMSRQQSPARGILTIVTASGKEHVISEFPIQEAQLFEHKDKGMKIVPVSYFIENQGIESGWKEMTFYSKDGAQLKVDSDELPSLNLSLIEDSQSPYLRLVIPEDDFPQRWLKYVNRIELK